MPSRVVRLLSSLALVLALGLGGTLSVSGYVEQVNIRVALSGPSGTVRCDRTATISAKVTSLTDGKPVANQIVRWSLTVPQSSADGAHRRAHRHRRQGRTSVKLVFGPAVGPRSVQALAGVAGSNITVRCAGGLPRTATVPPAGEVSTAQRCAAGPTQRSSSPDRPRCPPRACAWTAWASTGPWWRGTATACPTVPRPTTPGTAWPGEGSNTYLYAHAREGHFLELWGVRTGDLMELDMADGGVADYASPRSTRWWPGTRWSTSIPPTVSA